MVIIAPKRGKRPFTIADVPENPGQPAEDSASKKPDPFSPESLRHVRALLTLKGSKKPWAVKVIRNIFPAITTDNPNAYGTQEVVVETPERHIDLGALPEKHIAELLRAYQLRAKALAKDPNIQYILIYKNEGGRAGASVDHAHSQIFAAGFVPPHILEKLRRAEEYKIRHGRSYYMDLLSREKNGPRWVLEDGGIAALTPYASFYNYEVWIMPMREVDNITQITNKERAAMARVLKYLLMKIDTLRLPYNFYLHQVVKYEEEHLYIRLAPRKAVWAGVELGTRLIINSVSPEDAAKFYRPKAKRHATRRRTKRKK